MRELPCASSRGNSAMLWSPDLTALSRHCEFSCDILISYHHLVEKLTRGIAEFLTVHKSCLPQGSYNLWTLAARLFLEIVPLIRHARRWQRVFRSYCTKPIVRHFKKVGSLGAFLVTG